MVRGRTRGHARVTAASVSETRGATRALPTLRRAVRKLWPSTPDQVRGRPRIKSGAGPPLSGEGIAYGSLLGGGSARAACSTSPRVRGEVDLRAEPLRSEANRVRGLVRRLRLAATPPHQPPGTSSRGFAALGIRPRIKSGAGSLPACGERWRKWLCLAPRFAHPGYGAPICGSGRPSQLP